MNYRYSSILTVICFIFILTSCTDGKTDKDGVLFPKVSLNDVVENKIKLSNILDGFSLIKLETNPESLIGGRSNKIIKSDDHYFIQSMNEVLVFNKEGKYESKLARVGNGTEEYQQLLDFDIVRDHNEIWISSLSGIVRYKIKGFEFSGKIPLSFFANKIKYVGNDKFLAYAPDDKVFKLCFIDGMVLDSYFDKDPANSGLATIQFVKIGNKIISVLADSNSAVSYDEESGSFSLQNIISDANHNLVTLETNREYYNRFGEMNFSRKIMNEFIGIGAIRQIKNTKILSFRYPGIMNSIVINKGSDSKQYFVWPEDKSVIVNDITSNSDSSFLLSFENCESSDSFIFVVPDDNPELNPLLLETRGFK